MYELKIYNYYELMLNKLINNIYYSGLSQLPKKHRWGTMPNYASGKVEGKLRESWEKHI